MFDPKSQHFYTLNSSNTHTKGTTTNLGNRNISTRVKKPAQNYENYMRVNVEDILFKAQKTDDESDVCSPPLWKSSTPSDYESLSPNSRTRAIMKGQRELMEMARNMPESCYELSLRDMVESHVVESPRLDDEERCLVDHEKNFDRRSVKEILRQESKKVEKRMDRLKSASFEKKGLFLKMMFPVSIGSKKKKNSVISTSKRVSPKVETLRKSSTDNDWWKKKFSGSSGSEGGVTNTSSDSSKSTSSSGNSSNNSRKSKGWSSGCWSFALSRKNKKKSK